MLENILELAKKSPRITCIGTVLMAYIFFTIAVLPAFTKTKSWAHMPTYGNDCINHNDVTSDDCSKLTKYYGISPELYIQDTKYRKYIDAYQQKAVLAGSTVTSTIAEYSLSQIAKTTTKLQVLQSTLDVLNQLSEKEKNEKP